MLERYWPTLYKSGVDWRDARQRSYISRELREQQCRGLDHFHRSGASDTDSARCDVEMGHGLVSRMASPQGDSRARRDRVRRCGSDGERWHARATSGDAGRSCIDARPLYLARRAIHRRGCGSPLAHCGRPTTDRQDHERDGDSLAECARRTARKRQLASARVACKRDARTIAVGGSRLASDWRTRASPRARDAPWSRGQGWNGWQTCGNGCLTIFASSSQGTFRHGSQSELLWLL